MVDYAERFQLMVANTNLMKPETKLWIFQQPSGSRSQSRLYTNQKEAENSRRNCQSFSSFCSIGSDHRIVSCHPSFNCSKKPVANPMKTINWNFISSGAGNSNQFTIEDSSKKGGYIPRPPIGKRCTQSCIRC